MTAAADPVAAGGRSVERAIQFLEAEQRGPAARALRAQRDTPRGSRPTIVVAGEDKRGKSSLVNALLASPDLSPVGSKVVTGAPVRFRYAPEPSAQVFRYGTSTGEEVDLDAARRLATVEGNPGNEQNVENITIGLPVPLLEAMDIIDTPGVGGLSSGHAALTLQSLNSADALLFVVDAAAPLRASELAFLRRASARLQAVVLVVTKTDVHPGWRIILNDDVQILVEQAPRFAGCPTAGVSSVSALRALAMDDPAFAAEIRVESGIGGLEQLLRVEIASAVEKIRMQNLLRAAVSRLAVVERDLGERCAASAPDNAALDALNEQVAALAALREERVDWHQTLDADIRKLTLVREDTCARRTLEIRHRYEERVRNAKPAEFVSMPGEVLAELTALAGELNEQAAHRLAEITSGLLDNLDERVSVRRGIEQISASGLAGMAASFAPTEHRLRHGERMAMLSELGRGRSLLSLASGPSALAFLAPPFGLIVGIGLGGLFAFNAWRAHTQQNQVADFRIWLQEQIANAALTIRNGFAMQVVDLRTEIKSTVRQVLGEREQQLRRSIEEATALRKTEAHARGEIQRRLMQRANAGRSLRLEAVQALKALGMVDQ